MLKLYFSPSSSSLATHIALLECGATFELAPRLLSATGKSFQVHGEEIFLTASMGIAIYPRDGDNVIDLIRNADAALYEAKKAGGNCYEYYSSDMNTEAVERLMLKSKLRRAFERDELRLHYQPKYRITTGKIEGVEALLRWDLPERGLVFPSDFVPLAEETNLILQLGDWVLNRVCADYRAWQRAVPSPCRVRVPIHTPVRVRVPVASLPVPAPAPVHFH